MKIRTMRYCISEGFKNIFKNGLMSLAAIGTVAACLFILGLSYCVVANIDNMFVQIDDTLGIKVFMTEDITYKEIDDLKKTIEDRDEVKSIVYISPEMAWERFKKQVDDEESTILDGLEKDNPLSDSHAFEIHIKNASEQENFVNYLNTLKNVRKVNYSKESAGILTGMSILIKSVSLVLISILIFIAGLLIANTIRVAVYVRRYEINIMKYMGAKDIFIKFPFVVEGIFIGIIGAALPLLIIKYSYNYVINLIQTEFPFIIDLLSFLTTNQIISFLLPLFFAVGISVGIIGSSISVRKHLRV